MTTKPKRLIFVDCEAEFGKGAPSVGSMTALGAVDYDTRETFHGVVRVGGGYEDADARALFQAFDQWLAGRGRLSFVSDNPAYDWQWVNDGFWKYLGGNPFGHSARRIGDFYAGLVGDFGRSNEWKQLRVTKHDHNPVNDAMGNVEAFERMLNGERGKPR